jgi:transposase
LRSPPRLLHRLEQFAALFAARQLAQNLGGAWHPFDVIADEFKSYDGLEQRGHLTHYRVNHSLKEYAFEGVHVNTLEGYWSRLKNSIRGTHVHISEKHSSKYIDEFSFRYNMRKQPAEMFAKLISSV